MSKSSTTREWMTRGQLAKALHCNAETIRYYEQIDLLPKPKRTANGYRSYSDVERRRLGFILKGRDLGFSIEELRDLLSLVDNNNYTCGKIRDLTLTHLDDIRVKIRSLRRLEKSLHNIVSQCEGGVTPDCPIIEALSTEPF